MTQSKPAPGQIICLSAIMQGKTIEEATVKDEGLPLGQVVSYQDMANPYQEAVVVEEKGNGYGQKCIFNEDFHPGDVSKTYIDGLGGWQMVDRIADEDEIKALISAADRKRQAQADEQTLQRKKVEEKIERGRQLVTVPPDAVSYLVAIHEKNDCDYSTDYFNTIDGRTVFLAWSTHNRDLFPEMRKTAKLLPETEHLATADKDAEHREKWSMGSGYYLKAGNSYDTAWKVEKCKIYNGNLDEVYKMAADGDYIPLRKQEDPTEPPQTIKPTIKTNTDYNSVEIKFPQKPPQEIIDRLKAAGYRWAKTSGAWYNQKQTAKDAYNLLMS